ncbi:MAG: hypothetical protein J6P42_04830 [Oscillospiraceae bacterium]|nr:hypothetical protein [Oscillospiraceae bacterium]
MKKLFESPVFALLLAVVVVIGSTLLNTRIKFGRKCSAICNEFYEQSDSVSAELRNFCSAAEKVALTAQQAELPDANAALQDVDELRNLLYQQSSDLNSIHALYQQLLSSTFGLEAALSRMELSDTQAAALAAAQHDAAAAKAAIDDSDFNSSARSFLKRYQKFPTPTLAGMVGLNMPCAFD